MTDQSDGAFGSTGAGEALLALAERCEKARKPSNELDVLVEIALFEPDETFMLIRANSAGTKVICTTTDGNDETFRARDWTFTATHRRNIAAALRTRAAIALATGAAA